jgi:hypothetical protein
MSSRRQACEHRLMATKIDSRFAYLLFFPFHRPKKRRLMLDQMHKICAKMFGMNSIQVVAMTHQLAFELFAEHPDSLVMIAKVGDVELNQIERLFEWKPNAARGLPSGAIMRCGKRVVHNYSRTITYVESNCRTIWHFATLREVIHEFRELDLPLTEKCEHALLQLGVLDVT